MKKIIFWVWYIVFFAFYISFLITFINLKVMMEENNKLLFVQIFKLALAFCGSLLLLSILSKFVILFIDFKVKKIKNKIKKIESNFESSYLKKSKDFDEFTWSEKGKEVRKLYYEKRSTENKNEFWKYNFNIIFVYSFIISFLLWSIFSVYFIYLNCGLEWTGFLISILVTLNSILVSSIKFTNSEIIGDLDKVFFSTDKIESVKEKALLTAEEKVQMFNKLIETNRIIELASKEEYKFKDDNFITQLKKRKSKIETLIKDFSENINLQKNCSENEKNKKTSISVTVTFD